MKIAVFHNLPGGGGKRSLYEWLKIIHTKYEIDLYLYSKKVENFCDITKYVDNVYESGIEVSGKKGIFNKLITLVTYEFYSRKIAAEINKNKYDAIFVLQCQSTNSPAILRYINQPVVYYCQEPITRILEPHYPKISNGTPIWLIYLLKVAMVGYDRINARNADFILCNSYYSKESIYKAYGIYPSLVYLGIDNKRFKPDYKITKDKGRVISIGHLTPSKGHDFLILSIALVSEKIRPKLEIIYNLENSGYKEFLINLADSNKVIIQFSRSISDEQLIKKYNESYLVLCAARLEPLGLTPLEAMACGTPVISVAEAGLRETVSNGYTGILVERNIGKFASSIEKVLTNEVLYEHLSKNCVKYISDNWLWEYSASKLKENLQNSVTIHNA